MVIKRSRYPRCNSAYRLGDPIPVAEFLALPPDGIRYARDERGRLTLMSPEDSRLHRWPLAMFARRAGPLVVSPYTLIQEPGVVFRRIIDLSGKLVRRSFLGPKSLEPDFAVLKGQPRHMRKKFTSRGFVFVAEILSPSTWRNDLGIGPQSGDEQVDRRRTYLESGMSEYWVINPGVDDPDCPLAPRSAWFAVRAEDGKSWVPFEPESGVVRSKIVPGLVLDLEAYWADCGL